MVEKNKALIASAITVGIITILLLSGPANAFLPTFTIFNPVSFEGDKINFQAVGEVEADEIANVESFTLQFIGPENLSCKFNTNGTLLSPCPIVVQKISSPLFSQYGYGYLPGKFIFNITLDSTTINTGKYNVKLIATFPDKTVVSGSQVLFILGSPEPPIGTCSLRAKGGSSLFEGSDLGSKGALNLFNPKSPAVNGKGLLTLKKGSERVVYEFNVNKAYNLDVHTIVFETTGKVKENRNAAKDESAVIIYDTSSSEISAYGSSLSAQNMDITFAKC